MSKVEAAYTGLMHTLIDEAKEGPRLFSFEPVAPGFFDRPKWISAKFRSLCGANIRASRYGRSRTFKEEGCLHGRSSA